MASTRRYVDKHGEEIKAGMRLRFSDGSVEMVYETSDHDGEADLGINASNEAYMKEHGIPEEYREYYSLDNFSSADIEIIREKKRLFGRRK